MMLADKIAGSQEAFVELIEQDSSAARHDEHAFRHPNGLPVFVAENVEGPDQSLRRRATWPSLRA